MLMHLSYVSSGWFTVGLVTWAAAMILSILVIAIRIMKRRSLATSVYLILTLMLLFLMVPTCLLDEELSPEAPKTSYTEEKTLSRNMEVLQRFEIWGQLSFEEREEAAEALFQVNDNYLRPTENVRWKLKDLDKGTLVSYRKKTHTLYLNRSVFDGDDRCRDASFHISLRMWPFYVPFPDNAFYKGSAIRLQKAFCFFTKGVFSMWKLLNDDSLDIRFTDAGIIKLTHARRGLLLLKYQNEKELDGLKKLCILVTPPQNLKEMERRFSFYRRFRSFHPVFMFPAPRYNEEPLKRDLTLFHLIRGSTQDVILVADPFDETDDCDLGPYCTRFEYIPDTA